MLAGVQMVKRRKLLSMELVFSEEGGVAACPRVNMGQLIVMLQKLLGGGRGIDTSITSSFCSVPIYSYLFLSYHNMSRL